ncbi:hypothetical protein [Methanocella sp. MCL-LM]|uniref:hypothetical protein n=1 Tax=Methanocella sp. MCL-LM TaxID=3412035 RepID=UPI003C7163B9
MVFENTTKKQWLKVGLIVLIITIFRTMLQPLIPEGESSPFPPSAFVEMGLVPVAFVIYGVVMLGLLAIVFVLIQDRLPGTRLVKGLTFSVAFGMLWFIALLEPLPHGTWQLPEVLYYPVVDGVTLASLGLLLGAFVATDSKKPVSLRISPELLALVVIPVVFLVGRVVSYYVLGIYSSVDTRLFDTILWTFVFGLWIAVMYLMLKAGIAGTSPLAQAAFFGVIIFGINLFLNNLFMPIPFELKIWEMGTFSYIDLIARAAVDIIAVTTGAFICERIIAAITGRRASP